MNTRGNSEGRKGWVEVVQKRWDAPKSTSEAYTMQQPEKSEKPEVNSPAGRPGSVPCPFSNPGK